MHLLARSVLHAWGLSLQQIRFATLKILGQPSTSLTHSLRWVQRVMATQARVLSGVERLAEISADGGP